jgi:transposase
MVAALLAEGKPEEAWEVCFSAVESVLRKTHELELLVAKLRRERLGRQSERIDPGQLALLFETLLGQGPGAPPVDPEAEAQEDAALAQEIAEAERQHATPASPRRRSRPYRNTPAWQTTGVERHVHHVEVPPAERICDTCGEEKDRIGVDVTHRLVYVPGHFEDHAYHRDKLACGGCKDSVTTAPAPPQVLERSAADASVLAHVVVSKFVDHTPLHRLHRIYARSGVDIPVSTLADWTGQVADLVDPLVERVADRILQAHVVRTDATGLKVLDPQSPEHIELGTMWVYVGDDRDVLFRYTPTGEGVTGPWRFLAGRTGYVQADAALVFDRLFNGQVAHAIEVGCWSHARRKLVALRDSDCRVAYPLKLIARLYRIEHLADARDLAPDDRAALRQARAAPVLAKIGGWAELTRTTEPPRTELAKAAAYLANHWGALCRFLEDGRLDLDTNLIERQIRDLALGRKNYLFAGSHDAARRAANLYSLTRTCAQHGVPPLPYFTDVLRKLANGWTITRVEELLPHRWRPSNP